MSDRQGYYSIIQHSEFPERGEFVNIGVILFQSSAPRVLVRFAQSPRRIEAVFNVRLGGHFNDILASLSSRIVNEFGQDWYIDALSRFVAMRTGKTRMTEPRSILVENAADALEKLFNELVREFKPPTRRAKVTQKLKAQLRLLGVETMLDRPAPVDLHGVTLKAPYGYQNGRYNMINGLSLTDDPDRAIQAASAYAIKGRWLFENQSIRPSRLVVVADVEGQRENFTHDIARVMAEHNVGFHKLNDLQALASDIRDHSQPQATP